MPRLLALLLAYFFLGLAILGVFIPGLPTVIFLILAAWFAARGSERLHRWIYDHPHFGKLLIDWEQHGAIARKSKITAVLMISLSWGIMLFLIDNNWLLAGITLTLIAVSTFLITRPEPAPDAPGQGRD